MRVVVTGATGFIGSHLVERLVARGDEVHAWVRAGSSQTVPLPETVRRRQVDLLNADAVAAALDATQPSELYHLAAQSLPVVSWQRPWETFQVNVSGTINILEAARRHGWPGRLVVFGSSSEYADQKDPDLAIHEDYPLLGNSPYAVSKVAASRMAALYHRRDGIAAMVVRPFFWIGPRKTGDFCSDVARQLVRVERGVLPHLPVGNLDVVRDFLDVRDGVEAVLTVARRGDPGAAYNICSGTGIPLRQVIGTYQSLAKIQFRLWTDPALIRPIDEPVRIGNPGRIVRLGWQPTRALSDTLAEIVGYWRGRD
jgi:nucleoside-diphosphate-sugar epimerase